MPEHAPYTTGLLGGIQILHHTKPCFFFLPNLDRGIGRGNIFGEAGVRLGGGGVGL